MKIVSSLLFVFLGKNCVTSINDNASGTSYGLFFYPTETFPGFRRRPSDYFFRAYHLYVPERMRAEPAQGSMCMKSVGYFIRILVYWFTKKLQKKILTIKLNKENAYIIY